MIRTIFIGMIALLAGCHKDDEPEVFTSGSSTKGVTGIKIKATEWLATDLMIGSTVYVSSANAQSQHIYLQLRANGTFMIDNFVNECGGTFTTDNKSLIDFATRMDCTKTCCDPKEYDIFKDLLTSGINSYKVNADTTILTFIRDSDTFIKFKKY